MPEAIAALIAVCTFALSTDSPFTSGTIVKSFPSSQADIWASTVGATLSDIQFKEAMRFASIV